MLILGETSIAYYDDVSGRIKVQPLQTSTAFVAWTQIDAQRWVLADDFGGLHFLMIILDGNDQVREWKLDRIGETSRASVLVYLESAYLFVGSHQGDSQLVKIGEKSVEVVQILSNIAPILDFTIMDMGDRAGKGQTNEYSSGQARIITGSGAFQDGSLRSVRSGVGLEEQLLLGEMDNITDLFSLKSTASIDYADILVASFIGETRIFVFGTEAEVEEQAEYNSLALSEGSLLVTNLPGDRLLQVTKSVVQLIETGMVVSSWTPSGPITAASSNESQIVLSVGGTELTTLDLIDLRVVASLEFDEQVACIHAPSAAKDVVFAGFWENTAISILKTSTLDTIQTLKLSEDPVSVPRSILLTQLLQNQNPTLFVSMANGEVISFSADISNLSLTQKKVVVLGTQQANLKALPGEEGLFNIFATCEHPSLIYGSEGRIIYSAVTAEKASCVCPFDIEAYPGAIAIATPEDLKIALVDTERTTHVQTLSAHETVRRVAYSSILKAFGLGTIRRTIDDGAEMIQSYFKLVDEILFRGLDSFALEDEELVESAITAELRDSSGTLVERFVVGTAYLDDHHGDSVRGRILVFAVTQERSLKLVQSVPVKGACRALGVVSGNLVAALVKTVSRPFNLTILPSLRRLPQF